VLRFRPIMMTTMAAILGALRSRSAVGAGADLRQPLASRWSAVFSCAASPDALFTTPVTFSTWRPLSAYIGTPA